MTSRLLMMLQVVVAPPQKLGSAPHGTRIIAPITSGTFEGPRLRGKVLPGGGDWTLSRPDAVLELDLRITLETENRSEEHTSELQSLAYLVCRLLLEKKKKSWRACDHTATHDSLTGESNA